VSDAACDGSATGRRGRHICERVSQASSAGRAGSRGYYATVVREVPTTSAAAVAIASRINVRRQAAGDACHGGVELMGTGRPVGDDALRRRSPPAPTDRRVSPSSGGGPSRFATARTPWRQPGNRRPSSGSDATRPVVLAAAKPPNSGRGRGPKDRERGGFLGRW